MNSTISLKFKFFRKFFFTSIIRAIAVKVTKDIAKGKFPLYVYLSK